jgi:hypothetical protein
MYGLFAHSPGWLVLVTFMAVPALVAVALHAIFRLRVSPQKLAPSDEVAGFLVAIVGVLYAVVLGFMVITVWSGFDQAQRNADAETASISDILFVTQALPLEIQKRERELLGQYAHEVRDTEWGMLANDEEDLRARDLLTRAVHEVASARFPHTDANEAMRLETVRAAALGGFLDLAGHRRQRIIDSGARVQPMMYFAISVGGLILLAFVFLFGVDSWPVQMTMTALIAAMIGLQIGIIFEMDRPFWGNVHVSSEAWTLLIHDNHLRGAP